MLQSARRCTEPLEFSRSSRHAYLPAEKDPTTTTRTSDGKHERSTTLGKVSQTSANDAVASYKARYQARAFDGKSFLLKSKASAFAAVGAVFSLLICVDISWLQDRQAIRVVRVCRFTPIS